jgi:hypothetical protein
MIFVTNKLGIKALLKPIKISHFSEYARGIKGIKLATFYIMYR